MYNFRNRATNEYPVTPMQIRELHKQQVSFGPSVTEEVANMLGYDMIEVAEQPTFNPMTENCNVGDIVEGVQSWVVEPKSQAEIETAQLAYAQRIATETTVAIQTMLDTKCKEYEYDNINNATGWAPFIDDAMALATWGAACWAKSKEIRAEVLAGTRPMPTVDEVMAEMPEFTP